MIDKSKKNEYERNIFINENNKKILLANIYY